MTMKMRIIEVVVAALLCSFVLDVSALESRKKVNETLSKPAVRGGIAFKHYCILCHGETGQGDGRAGKLYKANLNIKPDTAWNYERIIRGGGSAVGRSDFMPPWQDELSEEQIKDVVAYLEVVTSGKKRGEVVYKANCILCHGIEGDGKGRAARLYNPRPANLTESDKNSDYKEMIIRLGGNAMGRSEVMPPWGDQLSNQEITDLVLFLNTLITKK